jgi:DNA-binding LacI/PurR family transcriptional regulator
VAANTRLEGELTAGRLLARSARHMAFLGDVTTPEIAQCYAGYQATQAAAGLTADAALLVHATFMHCIKTGHSA